MTDAVAEEATRLVVEALLEAAALLLTVKLCVAEAEPVSEPDGKVDEELNSCAVTDIESVAADEELDMVGEAVSLADGEAVEDEARVPVEGVGRRR